MFNLPQTTELNKKIPKKKFYDNLNVSAPVRKSFKDQIKSIYWRNKIDETTMNLAAGKTVDEIEIIEIQLNDKSFDESVLRQIDKEIPYHIAFLLEYDGMYQAWASYKEVAISGNNAFKVGAYYHTEWMEESELPLKIDGLNIDKVYENFVRQIAGDVLQAEKQESLKDSVERDNRKQELQKQIAALQMKVRKEKQLNKQVKINAELKKMKKELEDL